MNRTDKTHALTALLAITLVFANQGLRAQTAVDDTTTDPIITEETTTTDGSTLTTQGAVVDKLSGEFADFLGSEEQARELITDLRDNGLEPPVEETPTTEPAPTDPVTDPLAGETPTGDSLATEPGSTEEPTTDPTLTDPTTGDPIASEPVATESAKQLGYGEIRHTLKLAQAELLKLDITQPTDSELMAMLYGGEINGASVDGILAMRADGMGWGQIAQAYGFKLGELYGKGHVQTPTATAQGQGHMKGYIPSGGAGTANGYGRGIVTAGGGRVAGASTKHQSGKSHGHVKASGVSTGGIGHVSGLGNAGAGNGLASAQGTNAGRGLAKGHTK